MKKYFVLILISLVLFTSCNLTNQKPDYILKENAEYYWKVRFNPFNEDSVIYKYHKPVEYITTVNQKGGKRRVYYYDYNKRYVAQRRCPWYYNVKIGDKVKLRHNFEYNGYDTFVEVIK